MKFRKKILKGWKNPMDRRSGMVCVCVLLEKVTTADQKFSAFSGSLPTHTLAHKALYECPIFSKAGTTAKRMGNSIFTG